MADSTLLDSDIYDEVEVFYPQGEENAASYHRDVQSSDVPVLVSSNFQLWAIAAGNQYGTYYTYFYLENISDETLYFEIDGGSIDEQYNLSYNSLPLEPGKSGYLSVSSEGIPDSVDPGNERLYMKVYSGTNASGDLLYDLEGEFSLADLPESKS